MDKEGSAAITEEDFETCMKLKDSTNDETEGWEHMTTCTVAGCRAVIHRRERKVSNRGIFSRFSNYNFRVRQTDCMSTSALRHYPLERNSYAMCARGLIIARLGIRYLS